MNAIRLRKQQIIRLVSLVSARDTVRVRDRDSGTASEMAVSKTIASARSRGRRSPFKDRCWGTPSSQRASLCRQKRPSLRLLLRNPSGFRVHVVLHSITELTKEGRKEGRQTLNQRTRTESSKGLSSGKKVLPRALARDRMG